MRRKSTWVLAVLVLILLGVLLACSAKYSAQYNGLVIVPTRFNQIVQTFSLNLSNGGIQEINNPNEQPVNGLPSSVIIDPSGSFVYLLVSPFPGTTTGSLGVETYQIASDGKLAAVGVTPLKGAVSPVALAIDSAGKYIFVADGATTNTAGAPVPGAVSVLSVGSNGTLTEVAGSPFTLPVQPGGATASASALAVTPTLYPTQYAVCALQAPPSTENLYVTDSENYLVLNYSVNLSTGALKLIPVSTQAVTGMPTGPVPSGVAVDPCNRFLYVSNSQSNNVSAYTICSVVSVPLNCPQANYSLQPVAGSPYSTGDTPGPLSVDAYGNFLYVVATGSSYINAFRIGSSNGAIVALSPATYATSTALGQDSGSNSIAIRSDDSFVFVANSNTQTVSEFGLIPSTGVLSPEPTIDTYNYPSGVAVK